MKKLILTIVFPGILFGFQLVAAQNRDPANPVPDWVVRNAEKRAEIDKINGRDQNGMLTQPAPDIILHPNLEKIREKAEKEKIAAIKEINTTFAPPKHYLTDNAEFLKQKNVGITRIFPEANCGKGKTVSVEELERCAAVPQVVGSGSLYSIKLIKIPSDLPLGLIFYYIADSDIYFAGNKLFVGSKTTQSAISEIGEADIEKIVYNDESLKFLRGIKPDKNKKKFEAQRKNFEKGVTANGFLYSTSATVKLNRTYAMRSIAYRRFEHIRETFWEKDITALFKVIGQEQDGSIIMLWKILKEKKSPLIEKE